MNDFQPDPPRWKERQDQTNLAEHEAGRAIRFMRTPEPLAAAQLTRIAARVRETRPRRRIFWLTATTALLLCGATVAFAAHMNALPGWLTRIVRPRPADPVPRARAPLGPSARMPANPAFGVSAPSAALAPTSPPPHASVPALALFPAPREPGGTRVVRLGRPKTPTEIGTPHGSAKCLSEAIHALRVEHSPATALFLLDRHATQLGKSAFAHEALLVRVEAMLALHRKDEVLRLLDGMAMTDVAASHSLRVTRGELRAAANRCADGLGDFDWVLARSKQADRQALFGRALCRKKLGDGAGAQADMERYRREFPNDPRRWDLERQIGAVRR
jgi:hypothetical protein